MNFIGQYNSQHCCVCTGICGHIGGPYYCAQHSSQQQSLSGGDTSDIFKCHCFKCNSIPGANNINTICTRQLNRIENYLHSLLNRKELAMDLSQADLDKIKTEYESMMTKLQLYLVTTYDSISRSDAKKYIWEQLKKLLGT